MLNCREDRLYQTIVSHTAVTYFTKIGIYWDEERTVRPRITSAIDDSMKKLWFFTGLNLVNYSL